VAYTFTYTQAVSCPYYGCNVYMTTVSPPPGFHPTNMTVTQSVATTATTGVALVCVGGPTPGSGMITCNVAPGATSGSSISTLVIPAGTTGVQLQISSSGSTGGVTYSFNLTITVTYSDAVPPAPCPYGTRASAAAPTIAIITDSAITAALTVIGAPWLAFFFAPLVGYALSTGTVCTALPAPVPTITTGSLLETINEKLAVLNSIMWWSLCECVPGAGTVLTPPMPVLVQPPDFPVYGPYPCTNSDICTTLIQIMKRLDELNQSQQVNINQTTTVVTGQNPLAYKAGTVHSGLNASGSLGVSKLVGVRIEMTTGAPGIVLPGTPPYLWDVGWMSVSDGGAMLQEKRITRTSYEWFPEEMILASTFGYFLNPGVQVTMTELLPA
jgi:hypothetical protein